MMASTHDNSAMHCRKQALAAPPKKEIQTTPLLHVYPSPPQQYKVTSIQVHALHQLARCSPASIGRKAEYLLP